VGEKLNIIEVNGKRYDARTGKLLGNSQPGIALDGFTKPKVNRQPGQTAHTVHDKTKKSQTLMRTTVKKPQVQSVQKKAASQAVALDGVRRVKSVAPVPMPTMQQRPERFSRAEQTAKSRMISKFGAGTLRINTQPEYLPVKQPPAEAPAVPQQATAPSESRLFQDALQAASSHAQPRTAKPKRQHPMAKKLRLTNKAFAAGSATVAVLVIGSIFMYQHVPNVAMRVASTKAGLQGSVPGYKPSGYGLDGPIKFSPGEIVMNYKSTTDERNFKVTQRTSQWNDDALIKNFVSVGNRPFQTLQQEGRNIYIYDGSNATWLEKGVWYHVEGNSVLSSEQLMRIANSL